MHHFSQKELLHACKFCICWWVCNWLHDPEKKRTCASWSYLLFVTSTHTPNQMPISLFPGIYCHCNICRGGGLAPRAESKLVRCADMQLLSISKSAQEQSASKCKLHTQCLDMCCHLHHILNSCADFCSLLAHTRISSSISKRFVSREFLQRPLSKFRADLWAFLFSVSLLTPTMEDYQKQNLLWPALFSNWLLALQETKSDQDSVIIRKRDGNISAVHNGSQNSSAFCFFQNQKGQTQGFDRTHNDASTLEDWYQATAAVDTRADSSHHSNVKHDTLLESTNISEADVAVFSALIDKCTNTVATKHSAEDLCL